MAKLSPRMLQSFLAKAKEDDELPDYEDETDVEHESGEDYMEEAAEELEEAGASGDYEGFMELLFEHAGAIQAAASHVVLTVMEQELPEDAKEDIRVALEGLPEALVAGIKEHFANLTPDQLHEIVENLEESGEIENDASVVPFLYWAARLEG